MTTFSFLHMDTAYIDGEVVELTDADREWMHRHYTAHIAAGVPADAAVTPVLAAWLKLRCPSRRPAVPMVRHPVRHR